MISNYSKLFVCYPRLYANGDSKSALRGISHLLGFILTFMYIPLLFINIEYNIKNIIAAIIFSICKLLCYGCSSIFHIYPWSTLEKERIMQRADHASIHCIVAASAIPSYILVLDYPYNYIFNYVNGGLCLVGIIHCILKKNMMHYHILFLIFLLQPISSFNLYYNISFSLFLCSWSVWVSLIIAFLVYKFHWLDLWPDWFGYHESFHIFICYGLEMTSYINYKIL